MSGFGRFRRKSPFFSDHRFVLRTNGLDYDQLDGNEKRGKFEFQSGSVAAEVQITNEGNFLPNLVCWLGVVGVFTELAESGVNEISLFSQMPAEI